jgi:hypothetical protein
MKLNWLKTMSVIALVALVMTTGTAAFAASGHAKNLERSESLTDKVWIYNARPGDVIAAFQYALDPNAAADNHHPEGSMLESKTLVPANGQLEIFVPTLMPSVIYAWNEHDGYRFLGQVAPSDSDETPSIDAAGK